MKELLLAFVVALIIGSIINGWQQQQSSQPVQGSAVTEGSQVTGSSHDFPVTDSSFEQEVLKAKLPVLVDFWAPWCSHCKTIAPVVQDLSQEYAGRLKVVKLNTDENRKTAQAYNIRGLPSLYIFNNGQVVEHIVGAAPKTVLIAAINKHVEAVTAGK